MVEVEEAAEKATRMVEIRAVVERMGKMVEVKAGAKTKEATMTASLYRPISSAFIVGETIM